MNFDFNNLIMQLPGLAPHYTKHPIFPDMLTAAIVASLISIGLNFAIAMLRKKTTDIGKMNRIMKETNEWRKQYTDAIKKKDKPRIEELKKKQAYVNKMSMEMQQAADAPNVNLYGSIISTLDYCISDYLWPDYSPITNSHTMDNVHRSERQNR